MASNVLEAALVSVTELVLSSVLAFIDVFSSSHVPQIFASTNCWSLGVLVLPNVSGPQRVSTTLSNWADFFARPCYLARRSSGQRRMRVTWRPQKNLRLLQNSLWYYQNCASSWVFLNVHNLRSSVLFASLCVFPQYANSARAVFAFPVTITFK